MPVIGVYASISTAAMTCPSSLQHDNDHGRTGPGTDMFMLGKCPASRTGWRQCATASAHISSTPPGRKHLHSQPPTGQHAFQTSFILHRPLKPTHSLLIAVQAAALNEVPTGGLSSYCLLLMLIAHLQIEGFQPLPHSSFTLAAAKAATSALPLAEGATAAAAEAAHEPLFSSTVPLQAAQAKSEPAFFSLLVSGEGGGLGAGLSACSELAAGLQLGALRGSLAPLLRHFGWQLPPVSSIWESEQLLAGGLMLASTTHHRAHLPCRALMHACVLAYRNDDQHAKWRCGI